ncbi:MAG: hypothetical protein L6Q60_05480 [Rhodocyclaceae bacterium]|nr:hypothetical protein [Rhodocyclaceae bacterium]
MTEQDRSERNERPLPAAWTKNPFQAPTANVEDVRASVGGLVEVPNKLGAGQGSSWWSEGWSLFREAPALWVGMAFVLIAVIVVISLIPILGALATYLIAPIFSGGLMLGCRKLESGDGLGFGDLFAGFQRNVGQLALVGVLYLVGILVIGAGVAILGLGAGIGAAFLGGAPQGAPFATIMLAGLLGAVLAIPLAMAIWFAPALVMLNDLPAISAMKLSFAGCWRNMLPFLVYGLIGVVLAIVATLPFGLGWLVLLPLMVTSTYVAYKEIFLA